MKNLNILHTHKKIIGIVDALPPLDAAEHHAFDTIAMDATQALPVEHTFEASVVIPHGTTEKTHGRRFGERVLTLSLWTTEMPPRDKPTSGTVTRVNHEGREVRELVRQQIDFTTKGKTFDETWISRDGEDVGLVDPTRIFTSYLKEMSGVRVQGHQSMSEAVQLVSLVTNSSRYRETRTLDIQNEAKFIALDTDIPVPPSLRDVPYVESRWMATIPFGMNDPEFARQTVILDDYDGETNERILTSYVFDQFHNFPDEELTYLDDMPFKAEVLTLAGEPLGTRFNIDVSQQVIGTDSLVRATTEAEIDEMMNPLLRGVTNLRRYAAKVSRQER